MNPRDLDKAALRGEPSYVWRAGQQRRLEMILQAAGERVRGRVLENGCGVGQYVTRLASQGGEVIGLEYDFERAAEARRAAARIFLIHGEKDTVVSLNQANRLLSAAPEGQAQLWVVPGKGHSDCCTHAEFWDRLTAFLQETLPLA
jgi:fermentation-respiration switch protein FrsA (DUF1100 family)